MITVKNHIIMIWIVVKELGLYGSESWLPITRHRGIVERSDSFFWKGLGCDEPHKEYGNQEEAWCP